MDKSIFEIEITYKFPVQAIFNLNLITFSFLPQIHTTALKKHNCK